MPDDVPNTAKPPVPRGIFDDIRSRIISGLLFMLPIVITFWIISWIYGTLRSLILDPTAKLVRRIIGISADELPYWWQVAVSPIISMLLALSILYILGYFVSSRLSKALDWLLLHVPFVAVIYKAVSKVFQSLQSGGGFSFKRVVLVEYPHPGSRCLAFVTKNLVDPGTKESILSVWVLNGVMPPSGPVLFVREQDVIDLPWSVNDTIQVIISGGITSPGLIPFHQDSPAGLIVPHSAGDRTADEPH